MIGIHIRKPLPRRRRLHSVVQLLLKSIRTGCSWRGKSPRTKEIKNLFILWISTLVRKWKYMHGDYHCLLAMTSMLQPICMTYQAKTYTVRWLNASTLLKMIQKAMALKEAKTKTYTKVETSYKWRAKTDGLC
jgi:hypothetical protein